MGLKQSHSFDFKNKTINFYRAKNSDTGNSRFVVSWLVFATAEQIQIPTHERDSIDYDGVAHIAKKFGFKKYKGKNFGGGYIKEVDDQNLKSLAEKINNQLHSA